jgi:prepilin-type N-terminal cleavage/methylation domain-containing protein
LRKPSTRTAAQRTCRAFTLTEMLVSIAVLTLLVLMLTQLMNNAAPIAHTANKHIDTDTEARTVFDRMAVDFGKMLKRSDIDYWLKQQGARYYPGHSAGHSNGKGHTKGTTQQGSDQIAFYSQVPGYYPSTGSQSPISLVAYRVNTTTYQLERMGKGLLWNGVPGSNTPMVFLPLTIDQTWPAATGTGADPNYETIGPDVFRFEYYYLLKNGLVTDNPWNTDATLTPPHTSINGLKDVQAIAVAIAVIDPQSRSLLSLQNLIDLEANMIDFRNAPSKNQNPNKKTGDLEYQWGQVVNSNTASVPPAANQAIRIYSRFFNLNLP